MIYNLIYNFLPLLFYFTVFIVTIKRYPYFFVLFFYIFMQHIKNLLSNFYVNVNAPVFMREVEKYSNNDGSLLLLSILYISFFIVLFVVYKYFFAKKFCNINSNFIILKVNSKFFARFLIYFTLVLEIILIIHILSHNTPLFNERINKNNYWTDYALIPQIKIFSSQLSVLLFIVGFFFAQQKLFNYKYINNTFIYYLLLFISIVYYVLMKQKFGGPLLMLFSFFLPYFILGLFFRKIKLKKLFYYSFLVMVVLSITVYNYFYMKFGDDAIKMIMERIFSLQSEVWEVTYKYFIEHKLPFDDNEFLKELSVIFGFDNGYIGMQYVMSKVMEDDYFNFFISIHINLSSAYPSYLFYLFKDPFIELPFIFFVNLLLYGVYVVLGLKFMEELLKGRILLSALYYKLFFAFKDVITQCYLNSIFSFKIILFSILIILLESNLLRRRKHDKNIIY